MKKISAKATNDRKITDRLFGDSRTAHQTSREILRARSGETVKFTVRGYEFSTVIGTNKK